MKKTSMLKKFFGRMISTISKSAANVLLSILPKKTYLKFMRKNDTDGVFDKISDEVLLQSRTVVRIQTAIKASIMAVGTFLCYAIYKKRCYA